MSTPFNLEYLPSPFSDLIDGYWTDYIQQCADNNIGCVRDKVILASVPMVWSSSKFVTDHCLRNPGMLTDLVLSGDLLSATGDDYFQLRLAAVIGDVDSEEMLIRVLRQFRNREMVRIAWRDIAGWAQLEQTLSDLTLLAEVCLQLSLDYLYDALCRKSKIPVLSNGSPQKLVVLGMGKLGAWELNYSSDIDLIFAYPEDGVLDDKKGTEYSEFFIRLARSLINVIDKTTEDGFVFRVDTRLRPFGDSGPLVMSFDAMENYYQSQAREWERYAMIKARPVAGDLKTGEYLQQLLRPFVYRRYLDYGAFSAIRELKLKITQELQRKDRMGNIKLGRGGIREIEFIGQAFQLIRGGRDSNLQERRILVVLKILGEKSILPKAVVEKLCESYRFLRQVENRLQQYADQQTHDLPIDSENQLRLAFSLGYSDWDNLRNRLDETRESVHSVFEQVFESPQSDGEGGDADKLWMGVGDDEYLFQIAGTIGYQDPSGMLVLLAKFRDGGPVKRLGTKGIEYLNDLMPMVLNAVGSCHQSESTLNRILNFLEAIAGRSVYLSLLVENPLALSQLVKLADASSWIINYVSQYPLLLDELIDPRSLYAPQQRAQLKGDLANTLAEISTVDIERQMSELRHFKQSHILRVAATDIMDIIPLMVVSDYLTDIAEVILNQVLNMSWEAVTERYGVPPHAAANEKSGFAIIGYGKLGGMELGYGSDLDLVFLYDANSPNTITNGAKPIAVGQFYSRLGQKIISLLNIKMLSGVLYDIDMRLRPSGNSGLLVSGIDAFEKYQKQDAWTWEHQALVRARFIVGDTQIERKFNKIRADILRLPRDTTTLKQEVKEMREKMRANMATKDPNKFDIKQGRGGIVDIEFLVQYGVLSKAGAVENLVDYTGSVTLLKQLEQVGFFTGRETSQLIDAYCCYRDQGHKAALQEQSALVSTDDYRDTHSSVEGIWQQHMVS